MSDSRVSDPRVDKLSPTKRQLFQRLQRELVQSPATAPRAAHAPAANDLRVTERPAGSDCPLSIAQEALWFIERLSPGTPAYNVPAATKITGGLEFEALQRALDELVCRHEVLRMRFSSRDGRPYAVFDETPLTITRSCAAADEYERLANEAARKPFDLDTDRLLRVTLLEPEDRSTPGEAVLIIVAHHAICDGQSIEVFLDELQRTYARIAEGGAASGGRPSGAHLQFGDYAYWERQWLASDHSARDIAYWKAALGSGCPPLELPGRADWNGDLPNRASALVRFELGNELTGQLRGLASAGNSTLFMVLLSLWKLTFHAWSRQNVLVVGMPVVNRLADEVQDLLGMFTNTVVIRTVIDEDDAFEALLARVRERVVDALEHQQLPFAKLIETLRPERVGRQTPLVRATVWLRSRGPFEVTLPGVTTCPVDVQTGISTYDFSVVMTEHNGRVQGTITYPMDLFPDGVVHDMQRTFLQLAQDVAIAPASPIRALTQRVSATTGHALTANQLLVWLGRELHPSSTVYNECARWLIRGALDETRFEAAWRSVVERTDILRGRIRVVAGVPRLELRRDGSVPLRRVDLSRSEDPLADWNALTQSLLNEPVDLETALATCVIGRLRDDLYAVHLGVHQIATDAGSFEALYRRMSQAYAAALDQARAATAEGSPPQFSDVIEQDQRHGASREGAEARAHWEKELPALPSGLPTLYGLSASVCPKARTRWRVSISPEQEQALLALAARREFASISEDLTLLVISLTLFGAYVSRISDAQEFGIGVPFHNRSRPSQRETVGLLMTVCPLHIDVAGRPTFRALFDRIMRKVRTSLAHTRHVNANSQARPLYGLLLDYQAPAYGPFAGIESEVELAGGTQQLESLKLEVLRKRAVGSIELWLSADEALASAVGITRMSCHFRALLASMIEDPEQLVATVPMLTLDEEHALRLGTGMGTAPAEAGFTPVIERVQESVRRNPHSVAVVQGNRQLTYQTLWRRAGELATLLNTLGHGVESIVALSLTDGIERLIAILGVLRSGCAYLALNPSNPPARHRELLEQARPVLSIVDGDSSTWETISDCPAATLPALLDRALAARKSETGASAARWTPRAPAAFHPEQTAYVLFTSGSTGTPKGVTVTQRNLASFVNNACEYLGLSQNDRTLQFADASFDTSLEELFPTLLAGATLVIRPKELLDTPQSFWLALRQQAISVVDLPSSVWHLLGAALAGSLDTIPEALHTVIIGGEQAHMSAWQQWSEASRRAARLRPLRILNTYGPTETTVAVSVFGSTLDESLGRGGVVPIGRALRGVRIAALTPDLEPTSVRVCGELFISGVSVARGYSGRPAETASRFVPEPAAASRGARAYRTGDRAFLNDRGEWVYAGRRDRQVKHNGYRIELGEVESHLTRIPGVAAAAVFLDDRAALAACYVACAAEDGVGIDAVRCSLAETLPPFMRPSAIFRVAAIPLDSRGKVDYARLRSLPPAEGERLAARTHVEEVMAKIWSEVLGLPPARIGSADNFFHIGGHSLLGTQLVSRIRSEFGVELTLQALFDTPTIAGLATTVTRLSKADDEALEARRNRITRGAATRGALSFPQLRQWFLDQLDPGNSTYNSPVAVRLRGPFDAQAFEDAINRVIRRHEVLRTRFLRLETGPEQVVEPELIIRLQPLALPPSTPLEEVLRRATNEPFDLAALPLVRAYLVRLAPDEHAVLIVMHHIIADGWSLGLFVKELVHFYGGGSEAPLAVQYLDYAVWERSSFRSELLKADLAWWLGQLRGAPMKRFLPLDRERTGPEYHRGATVRVELPRDLIADIRRLASARDTTPFVVLLTGLSVLLSRRSTQTDFLIGTPVANRPTPELEELLGLFVNTLVLRMDLGGNPRLDEALDRTKRVVENALSHRHVPFEKIVEALQPERRDARDSLFQVMVTYFSEPTRAHLDFPGLRWEPIDFERGFAYRDLTFRMGELQDRFLMDIEYRVDALDRETIESLAARYTEVLRHLVRQPEMELGAVEVDAPDRSQGAPAAWARVGRQLLQRTLRRAPVQLDADSDDVRPMTAAEPPMWPLVLCPSSDAVDLPQWLARNRERVSQLLSQHGAILWRGFDIRSNEAFSSLAEALGDRVILDYSEASTPRTKVGSGVFTSTEYPGDQTIKLHNECAYLPRWPSRLYFYCEKAAERGGATTIGNMRRIFPRIDPAVREAFSRRGVLYVRNFHAGIDLPWQEVYRTSDKQRVDELARESNTQVTWREDGGLSTRLRLPAVLEHPQTRDPIWFNSAHMFHVAGHEPAMRESLRSLFGDCPPRHAYYGDGGAIPDAVIEHICEVYRSHVHPVRWCEGDVLLVDNLLTAHGREPFTGTRRVLVMMTEPRNTLDVLGAQ